MNLDISEFKLNQAIHHFTSEEKSSMFGSGPWCEEPDVVFFSYKDVDCKVIRTIVRELSSDWFGGHLCGYVKIPTGHKFIGHDFFEDDFNLDVHGGITFNAFDGPDYWIGFDCGHSGDVIPSMQNIHKECSEDENTNPKKWLKELNDEMKNLLPYLSLFNPIYRDMNYVMDQTMGLAKQVIEIDKKK